MDDFHADMYHLLKNIKQKNKKASSLNEMSSSSVFVDGLVPINPNYWSSHWAGSIFYDELPQLKDKVDTLENIKNVEIYLETSQSDVEYRDPAWTATTNTMVVNLMAELGGQPGAFFSGHYANLCADKYVNEEIQRAMTLNDEEKVNLRIFQSVAIQKNIDPDMVQGTGSFREFVPDYMKKICVNSQID